jgi:2-dehydro-3-deoxyphosphogluconate aldolase/(4S)-4-hydroxy-2-oxoglutarate aldolase
MNALAALDRVRSRPIFAIVRAPSADSALRAARAAATGGITLIEIALSTPGAYRVISDVRREYADKLLVGAGSVVSVETADRAIKAGAQFIGSPHTSPLIIDFCKARNLLVMPGAATFSEIMIAWGLDVPMVRVLPVSAFGGSSYVKALKASLEDVRLVPIGGIRPEEVAGYFGAGAWAIGIGTGLFVPDDVRTGSYAAITDRARLLVQAFEHSG